MTLRNQLKMQRPRILSAGLFVKANLEHSTNFGNECARKVVPLFVEACQNRGIAATDNYFHQDIAGAEFQFDFSIKEQTPFISACPDYVDKLDIEILAQYLASWCRPVFGKTHVEVKGDRKDHVVVICPFSEFIDESFVAFLRMEKLCQNLALPLHEALKKASPIAVSVTRRVF